MRNQGTYLGSVVLIVVVLLLADIPRAIGQASPGAVQVERLELVDDQGLVRASLAMGPYGPELCLRDEQGKTRVKISDYELEVPRIDTGLHPAEFGPGMRIYDDVSPKPRAVLFLCNAGSRLILANSTGNYTAGIGADETTASCYVAYPNGIIGAKIKARQGQAGLTARTEAGATKFWGLSQ